ncbi:hypothetical protein [Terriglobus roseus]|uniref:Uncharacterized protein n=1 Tax=Terriglobus roseus TaxID=392734 RepID=A0A1G7HMU7_9BACT|nr:hypothetical protein [Terriglobus roseus]SDF01762.1 hypothetical protein SAMN05444167_1142 [Terriglobus roseus]
MNMNRRNFLWSSLSTAFLAGMNSPQASRSRMSPVNDSSPEVYSFVKPSDPGFERLVNASFPGILELPEWQTHRRKLVLVRNGTSFDIYAHSVTWSTNHDLAQKKIYRRTYMSRPALNDKALGSGCRPLLKPGESGIVTPLVFCSSGRYMDNGFKLALEKIGDRHSDGQAFLAATAEDEVNWSTDGAVFDNIAIAPPNSRGLLHLLARFDGEREAAQEALLAIQNETDPFHAITASRGSSKSFQHASRSTSATFQRAKREMSVMVKVGLEQLGSEALQLKLSNLLSRPKLYPQSSAGLFSADGISVVI